MQKIILDVIPNGVCPRVYVNQYDIGREFQISFKEGLGSYYFQNNLTFTINGRKSDNHIFEYTEADKWDSTHYVITKSGSGASTKVTIGTTEQMTAAPGETDVQLIFTDSTNAVIGTLSFIMVVQECPGIVGDPSESVVPDVVRSVNNVRPSATGNVYLPLSEIDGIDDNVAYTERTREMGTQHVAGEFIFVDSDNQLYEITSTINSGGTLTPGTNATARSVGDALSALTSDLTSIKIYPNTRIYFDDTTSYTATENCYVVACASTSPVYIDDVAATLAGYTYCGFLKSGQKISFEASTRLSVWSLKA